MKHRVSTERVLEGPRNSFNVPSIGPKVPVYTSTSPLFCYVQEKREVIEQDDGRIFTFTTYLLLAPLGADLLNKDSLLNVVDRGGRSVVDGRLRIAGLVARESHLEGKLEKVG